jgi:anhydro-N-acetylmuramic acid kinase
MDHWSLHHRQQPYDQAGDWARSGRCDPATLQRLLSDDYFQRPAPKSTGPEHFNLDWLRTLAPGVDRMAPQDIQATLCELTAHSVTQSLRQHAPECERLICCGGGVNNRFLLERLQFHLPQIPVCSSADYGIDPEQVEAIAFAWLAKLTLEHRPGNLPTVTGARKPVILGGIYPA